MHALFVHDTYYSRGPDDSVYSFGAFPYKLWAERFLPHFHSITVIGREKPFEPSHTAEAVQSDGPGVHFVLLPNINAPLARIFSARPIINQITAQIGQADAIIVRGPSEFGMIAARAAKMVNKPARIPLAVEMSGCALDHTWSHGTLTAKLYALVKYYRARKMLLNADHVIYVTEKFLQSRYPTNGTSANASNVEIEAPSSAALQKRLSKIENQESITFGMIGNSGNRLKGVDIAIGALARIQHQLPPFEFRVLGHEGPSRYMYSFLHFDKPIPDKNEVMTWLDGIDIYLQPSRHEGLPRALIEAMSRACPALASDAGGTDELLAPDKIHRRGDVKKLSGHILYALNPEWQKREAEINFERSKKYSRDILIPIRDKFWNGFAVAAYKAKTLDLPGQAQHEDILAEVGT